MRGSIDRLANPHPLATELPSSYRDDRYVQEFLGIFDQMLAPVFLALDNLDAYLDPAITPDDFLGWLAGWVAAALDENWPIARQREFIAQSTSFDRWRGTSAGLAEELRAITGHEVTVSDSGGSGWSQTPLSEPPGSTEPRVVIRVRATGGAEIDVDAIDTIVGMVKPAHVIHAVEVV